MALALSALWATLAIAPVAHATLTTFQEGVAGYVGTQDTELTDANPTGNLGGNLTISADLSPRSQGLIKFENIVGTGPGQIPPGSVILSAELTVNVVNETRAETTIALHRVLVPWTEASNWDEFFFGLEPNDVELIATPDAILGDNTPGVRTFTNLQAAVQAWVDGGSNEGWAILSDRNDGWDFESSESPTPTARPRLVVEYQGQGPAEPAVFKAVQSGTTTSSGNGTVTVPLDPIDPDRSFLIFNTSHASDRVPGALIRGRIASATSLEFARVTDEFSTISIQWYVVEYSQGVRVQRGEVAESATAIDIPLPIPVAVNQAFPLFSKTPAATNQAWSDDDALVAELTSASTLQLRVTQASASHIIWWEVVEFLDPAAISVQKGTITTMTAPTGSVTETLATAVDPAQTFLLTSYRTLSSTTEIGPRLLRGRLTSSTTLEFDRSVTNATDSLPEIVWHAVELKDGSRVQHGSEPFAVGELQRIVPLNAIDLQRGVAFTSTNPGAGQGLGRGDYLANDILGEASVRASLPSATQLQLDRDSALGNADFGWFVVEFGASTSVDLAVLKSVDEMVPTEGDTITYTVTVDNAGPGVATAVAVADTLPTGLTFLSAVASQGSYTPVTGLWSVGDLLASSGATLDITAFVNFGTAGSTLTNTASVQAVDQSDDDPLNDAASVDIDPVAAAAELAVTKIVDDPAPTEGDTLTYTISLDNAGPAGASAVAVADPLPAGVTFVSAAPSQGDYDEVAGIWTLGAISAGSSASLMILAEVDAGSAGTTITNTASVSASDRPDTDPGDDSASVDVVPAPAPANLSLTKVVDDAAPAEGDTVTYTVSLVNAGPAAATAITVNDTLVTGLAFVSASPSQGSYDQPSGDWTFGPIPPSGQATLEIRAQVEAGTAGLTLTNVATITASDRPDTNASDDTAAVDVIPVAITSDLALTKVVDDATPAVGDTVTFTLDVANTGPFDASGVIVADLLPAGLTFVSANASLGSYDEVSGAWDVGPLNDGNGESLTIAATVDTSAVGTTLVNQAAISALDQIDPNTANDDASATLDVFALLDVATGDAANANRSNGVAWGDVDGDGDLDMYISVFAQANMLLRNDGADSFVDIATGDAANADETAGVAWADYDNDGDLDLFSAQQSSTPNTRLFRNDAGDLLDVTPASMGPQGAATAIGWADYDKDGDVDLYIANINGANQLFRNDGGDSFVDVTPPVLANTGAGTSVTWGDYDNDGNPDLYLGKGGANRLYRNLGDGNFVDVTTGPLGHLGSTFGVAWGDYDNDEDLDLFVANSPAPNKLMRNDGGGSFADVTTAALADDGLLSQGVSWSDFDNDGDLDLTVTNAPTGIVKAADPAPNRLFRNDGTGFVDIADGSMLAEARAGQGIAWADYDQDGDVDLYVTNTGTPNQLLRNDLSPGRHWLHVDLTGTVSNASAIGARVRVEAAGSVQIREVTSGSNFLSQESFILEFGLGDATVVDALTVSWPSGQTTNLTTIAADQALTIVEPSAADLSVAKTVDNAYPAVGDTVVYTIDLINEGPGDATGIEITDLMPAEVNVDSATPSVGTFDLPTGLWSVGSLANGETASLQLSAIIQGGAGSILENVAAVTAVNEIDTDPLDNMAMASIEVFLFQDVTTTPLDDPGPSTGVAWIDHDGDSDLDLFLGSYEAPNRLFQNEGQDTFIDVATGALANPSSRTNGVAWSDYDNDGDLDVYYATRGSNSNRLMRNDGAGAFEDVTPPDMANTLNGQSVAWADYDNDGDTDLYLANLTGPNQLFRNDGGDSFVDATPAPLAVAAASTSVAWADYDDDGDLDIYVAGGGANQLFRNDGASFVDVTAGPLAGSGSSFGVDWGDYDNDGDLDLYLANANEANVLMRNDGTGFVDVTVAPLDDPTGQGQSVAWADFDNDGDLDLYVSNLAGADNRLLRNDGAAGFRDLIHASMSNTDGEGQGLAWGDYDADGDLDIYVANAGQSNHLYRNELADGSHWIHIDLTGTSSNRSAIGARVSVAAGGIVRTQEISGGSGYLSQNSLRAEFGLGATSSVDSVTVRWPSGTVDVALAPPVDAVLFLVETPLNLPPIVTPPGDPVSAEGDVVSGITIDATDPNEDTLLFAATNLPPGLSLDPASGEFSGTIDCGASANSPYLVDATVDDQNGNVVPLQFQWTVTPSAGPPAVADLTATQLGTANGAAPSGTTRIRLDWSGVAAENTIQVYRKGFGSHPEYDDAGGSIPTPPATPTDAVTEGWALTGANAPAYQDVVEERDYWYFVAFVTDTCGAASPPSNMTTGTLNYHLGDVSDGFTPGNGDRLVNAIDLSLLATFYGTSDGDGSYRPDLDVGPTVGGAVDGLPLTDDIVEFEDLVVLSINFNQVSKSAPLPAAPTSQLTLRAPTNVGDTETVTVFLDMQGDGSVRALRAQLDWDETVVEPTSVAAGDLLDAHGVGGAVLSALPGTVDAALMGTDSGIHGDGLLASITFRILGQGAPGFGLKQVDARSVTNRPVTVETAVVLEETVQRPLHSELTGNHPNPFNPRTTLDFAVGKAGPVILAVYGIDGRLVRTLVRESLSEGRYEAVWDGRDEQGRGVGSGVYIARLQAADRIQTRRMVLIK